MKKLFALLSLLVSITTTHGAWLSKDDSSTKQDNAKYKPWSHDTYANEEEKNSNDDNCLNSSNSHTSTLLLPNNNFRSSLRNNPLISVSGNLVSGNLLNLPYSLTKAPNKKPTPSVNACKKPKRKGMKTPLNKSKNKKGLKSNSNIKPNAHESDEDVLHNATLGAPPSYKSRRAHTRSKQLSQTAFLKNEIKNLSRELRIGKHTTAQSWNENLVISQQLFDYIYKKGAKRPENVTYPPEFRVLNLNGAREEEANFRKLLKHVGIDLSHIIALMLYFNDKNVRDAVDDPSKKLPFMTSKIRQALDLFKQLVNQYHNNWSNVSETYSSIEYYLREIGRLYVNWQEDSDIKGPILAKKAPSETHGDDLAVYLKKPYFALNSAFFSKDASGSDWLIPDASTLVKPSIVERPKTSLNPAIDNIAKPPSKAIKNAPAKQHNLLEKRKKEAIELFNDYFYFLVHAWDLKAAENILPNVSPYLNEKMLYRYIAEYPDNKKVISIKERIKIVKYLQCSKYVVDVEHKDYLLRQLKQLEIELEEKEILDTLKQKDEKKCNELLIGLIRSGKRLDIVIDMVYSIVSAYKGEAGSKLTPYLHDAVRGNNLPVLNLLLEENADVRKKDKNKETPLELALRLRYQDIIQRLRQEEELYKKGKRNQESPILIGKAFTIIDLRTTNT